MQEAVQSKYPLVQFHALALLHQVIFRGTSPVLGPVFVTAVASCRKLNLQSKHSGALDQLHALVHGGTRSFSTSRLGCTS